MELPPDIVLAIFAYTPEKYYELRNLNKYYSTVRTKPHFDLLDVKIALGYSVRITDTEITWLKNGLCHCEDGPAVEAIDGEKRWCIDGQLHRVDGPAIETFDSSVGSWYRSWHQNGCLHREDGPAIMYPDGTIGWYLNGVPHRTDGPAIIYSSGLSIWYKNGLIHRIGGPAITSPDRGKEYWVCGEHLSLSNYIFNQCMSVAVGIVMYLLYTFVFRNI